MAKILNWEGELEIKRLSEDQFTNVSPLWDWNYREFIAGPVLMAHCLKAATYTLANPDDFFMNSLNTTFMRAGSHQHAVIYNVQRLGDGKNICSRLVQVKQGDKLLTSCTITFKKRGTTDGSVRLRHAIKRRVVNEDGSPIRPPHDSEDAYKSIKVPGSGGNIQVVKAGVPAKTIIPSSNPIGVTWARILNKVSAPTSDRLTHMMGLIYATDVGILDAAPRVMGMDPLSPTVPGTTHSPDFDTLLSLNHTVHVYDPERWRCDEWFYSESELPWASPDGRLILDATFFHPGGEANCQCEGSEGLAEDKVSAAAARPEKGRL
ncbi:hypothetical protein B7463_g2061, partial [Scytalidium lignicola]